MKSAKRILALLLALLVAFPAMTMLAAVEAKADVGAVGWTEELTKIELTMTPDSANGKGSDVKTNISVSDNKIVAPDVPSKITANNPSEFAFKGWWYAGTSKFYQPGDSIPIDSNDVKDKTITLTAMYESKTSASVGSTVASGSTIYGTYKSGVDGLGNKEIKYKSGEEFTLPENPFSSKTGYTFKGWSVNGKTYGPGSTMQADSDFTIYAVWDFNDRVVVNPGNTGSSSSSSSSSTSSIAQSSSSSVASSKPASSSTASKKPASSSSSSATSIETSSEEISSSVPETPSQPEVFQPIDLAYSISGNVPITKVNFLLEEDIGGTPQLWVTAIDSYSTVDAATSRFIKDGDALGAFDLSILLDGNAYTGSSKGKVTYALNGTQANAESKYGEHVLAMVHVTELSKFSGTSYYMADGKKAYLVDSATGAKSEVSNISFDVKDGVSRPIVGDVNSLSTFAYLAAEGVIVEVKLVPDVNSAEASLDVTGLSPILLVQMEVGKASTSGFTMPGWLWIVIGVVVLIVVALLVFYFINRNNENKRQAKRQERLENYPEKAAPKAKASSSVTGFDD